MEEKSYLSDVKYHTQNIISCGNDYYVMKQSVDGLYQIFSEITGIKAYSPHNNEIILPTGKAISPEAAAHCLIELKRTAVFLRGIDQAIKDKSRKANKPIKILYAGCGPYGTLITPLLSVYPYNKIKVTLIDINETSLKGVKTLLQTLKLDHFIEGYLLEDASVNKPTKEYDILISETMQACLEKEPQVHIMQNLIPQLQDGSIFIPERIAIDAYLTNPKLSIESKLYENRNKNIVSRKFLGRVFEISKENLKTENLSGEVSIPKDSDIDTYYEFRLFTEIQVYKKHTLENYDCSLTLPKKIYDFKNISPSEKVKIRLNLDGQPKIEYKTID
ncbi:MAG: methyltransferase domain-containing protein [Prolixibacteraceae bacterium]|nr:methyltransferase domain-containing protein [Prolixibacteraceae bacterium]